MFTRTRSIARRASQRCCLATGANRGTTVQHHRVSTGLTERIDFPLTVADIHLRDEQLPFCYFFRDRLNEGKLHDSLHHVLQQFITAGGTVHDNYRSITCAPTDTVPLTFATVNTSTDTLQDWLAQGHQHESGGQAPVLLPLFDALQDGNLLTARVTYFQNNNNATAIAINMSHLLGDTASCIQFADAWGKAYSGKSFGRPCLNRASAATSGIVTSETVELMGLDGTHSVPWWSAWLPAKVDEPLEPVLIEHEYVSLSFPADVLRAMKEHGTKSCQEGDTYISTNDMIMAVAWLLKRKLSKQADYSLSVVLNVRGRAQVSSFDDCTITPSGLFGNGITHVVAELEPTTIDELSIDATSNAARSIRRALLEGLAILPDRLAYSRQGKPQSASCFKSFSTTSWAQLSPRQVDFASALVGFHGQPAHPLPAGNTFSSVVHSNLEGNGCTYELFMPSNQVEEARLLHELLCESFLKWREAQADVKKEPLLNQQAHGLINRAYAQRMELPQSVERYGIPT